VDVVLTSGSGEWPTPALIDTGAPRTTFDRGAAGVIEVDLSDQSRQRLHFLAGREVWAVPVTCPSRCPRSMTALAGLVEVEVLRGI